MGKSKNALQPAPGLYIQPARGTGPSMFQSTFSTLSFITVGDKYGTKPPIKGTRFAGKQFSTTFPKKGTVADSYFTKEFQVIGGEYADSQPQRYLKTQPRDKRKQGFLSGDASKRDEIMNSTMSNVLATTFKKEMRLQQAAQEKAMAAYTRLGYDTSHVSGRMSAAGDFAGGHSKVVGDESRASRDKNESKNRSRHGSKSATLLEFDEVYEEGRSGPEFLFDIGRGAETSFCSRSKRERWFEPRIHSCRTTWSQGDIVVQGVEKKLGSSQINLSSLDIGVGARELQERTKRTKQPVEFEASPHSRRSVLQQQLNRNCGALLPPFSQSSISAAGPPGSTLML